MFLINVTEVQIILVLDVVSCLYKRIERKFHVICSTMSYNRSNDVHTLDLDIINSSLQEHSLEKNMKFIQNLIM